MTLTLRKKKVKSKWKRISSCMYPENITSMIREIFYSDTIDAKKISDGEYEIHNLNGKVENFRVRFDHEKERYLFEQKFN